jgi:hypothetical protein
VVVTRESFAIIAPERTSSIGAGYRGVRVGGNATKPEIMSHKGAGVGRWERRRPRLQSLNLLPTGRRRSHKTYKLANQLKIISHDKIA